MGDKIQTEIRRIDLNDASFKDSSAYIEPTYVNFLFGNNGTGKSTITKTIQNGVGITYAPGKSADNYLTLIFNQEFIDANFQSYHKMPGVFTINEKNVEIQNQIESKLADQISIIEARKNAIATKKKKESDKETLIKAFHKDCWDKSATLRKVFDKTQDRKRKSKQFTDTVIAACPSDYDLDELRRLYDSAYSKTATSYDTFNVISDVKALDVLEGYEILGMAIVNTSMTPFAEFIKKVNATKWVHQGHEQFSHIAGSQCPYCQQSLPANFDQILSDSFDTHYQENVQKLKIFLEAYKAKANEIFIALQKTPVVLYPKVDIQPYNDKLATIKTAIQLNISKISEKIDTPSTPITLENIEPLFQDLTAIATGFNKLISENNAIVAAGPKKRKECTDHVFSLLAFQLKEVIDTYKRSSSELDIEISAQQTAIKTYEDMLLVIKNELKTLSSQTVETESAKEKMNALLLNSGIQGFQLEPHEITPHVYKVVRPNGEIANNLSEGEKNFIAFLYFYYLVQGSHSSDGETREKIVAIDDPVSSMDNNSLFIISTLIRNMIEICRNNADNREALATGNYIKQIFILTHNAFFHRQITYSYLSRYEYVSFYLIRKRNNQSSIKLFEDYNPKCPTQKMNINPVKNSYAALWEEYIALKTPVPLMNVIRQILEYYFLQMCGYEGLNLRKIILVDNKDMFVAENGKEDLEKYHLASAMLSYLDTNTNSISDGLNYIDDCLDISQCKATFEMIFELMSQGQHYKMMMGIN